MNRLHSVILPKAPSSTSFLTFLTSSEKRSWEITVSFLPDASLAAITLSASAAVNAIGFSSTTCLPFSSASIAFCAWRKLGVQIFTISISDASISEKSENGRAPYFSANARARAGSASQTATSSAPGISFIARAWIFATMPQPRMPNLSLSNVITAFFVFLYFYYTKAKRKNQWIYFICIFPLSFHLSPRGCASFRRRCAGSRQR